jgi:hypothetical protein
VSPQAARRIMACVDSADYQDAGARNALEANEELDADGHTAWVHDYEPDRRVAVDRLDRVTVHKLHLP